MAAKKKTNRANEGLVSARVELDIRELSMILAALRYYQNKCPYMPQDIWDIATNGGEVERLGADEIDDLCERLNMDKP